MRMLFGVVSIRRALLFVLVFASHALGPPEASLGAISGPLETGRDTEATIESRVMAFVLNQHPADQSLDSGRALGPEAVETLRRLLSGSEYKPRWDTIVSGIAFAGGRGSYGILRAFIWDRFTGRVDDTTLGALVQATAVIGTIPPDAAPELLDYLERATDPQFWRTLPWEPELKVPKAELAMWFSSLSISTLSYTGTLRAHQVLWRLKKSPHPDSQSGLIDEALRRNARVAQVGLAAALKEERAGNSIRIGPGN